MKFYACEKLASLILGKCHAHETGKRERGFKFPTGFCHPMLQIEDPSQRGHHGGPCSPTSCHDQVSNSSKFDEKMVG